MKIRIILSLLLPLLGTAVELLRHKDENSTGADDLLADAMDAAIRLAQKYLTI
ncbi:MAG: hypothetical protein L0220_16155 [Acidobacteria bacterium]|nr:hypothetical protein [Acidobacteriota bacterium]